MEIEIQDFYPSKPRNNKVELTGTLSLYVVDYDLDIRGIVVDRVKGRYYFRLPSNGAFDEDGKPLIDNGRRVRYPIVTFTSRQKQDELMAEIRKLAPAFIEKMAKEICV